MRQEAAQCRQRILPTEEMGRAAAVAGPQAGVRHRAGWQGEQGAGQGALSQAGGCPDFLDMQDAAGQEVIDMPMATFLGALMARQPGCQIPAGRAHIEVAARSDGDRADGADLHHGWGGTAQDQEIGGHSLRLSLLKGCDAPRQRDSCWGRSRG